jgi:hypothetical protein
MKAPKGGHNSSPLVRFFRGSTPSVQTRHGPPWRRPISPRRRRRGRAAGNNVVQLGDRLQHEWPVPAPWSVRELEQAARVGTPPGRRSPTPTISGETRTRPGRRMCSRTTRFGGSQPASPAARVAIPQGRGMTTAQTRGRTGGRCKRAELALRNSFVPRLRLVQCTARMSMQFHRAVRSDRRPHVPPSFRPISYVSGFQTGLPASKWLVPLVVFLGAARHERVTRRPRKGERIDGRRETRSYFRLDESRYEGRERRPRIRG